MTRLNSYIAMSLGVGMAAAFWVLLLGPHRRDLAALRTSARSIRAQVANDSTTIAGLSEIRGDIKTIKQASIEFGHRVRPTADVGLFIKDVSQLADRLGLQEPKIIPLTPIVHGPITVLPIQISYESRFGASFSFVRDMERMSRAVRVTHLAVERKELGEKRAEQPAGYPASLSHRCSTELTVHLYCESIEVESST